MSDSLEPPEVARPEAGEHVHAPAPSIWPMVLAGAITLVAFGVITSWVFSGVGVVLMAWALYGWIGELLHE
jgi:hypothetical protein